MAITYIIRMQERSKGGACSREVLINKEILALSRNVNRRTVPEMVGWGEGCGTLETCG
jgi:hypothetical protein